MAYMGRACLKHTTNKAKGILPSLFHSLFPLEDVMFIQAGSHYVVQPGFELKDILLPQHIPSATITGICYHAQKV